MSTQLVHIFKIEDQLIAFPIENIEQVIRSVEIKVISGLPVIIKGFVNLHGELIPLIDLRSKLNLSQKELSVNDSFVIVSSERRRIAVVVTEVLFVVSINGENNIDLNSLAGNTDLATLTCLNEEIVMIYQTDQLLNESEEGLLENNTALISTKKLSA